MKVYKIVLPLNDRNHSDLSLEMIVSSAHLQFHDMTALGQDRRSARTYYLFLMDETAFPFDQQLINFRKYGWELEESTQNPEVDLRFKAGDIYLFDQYLANK
jgi:hypothetical protein